MSEPEMNDEMVKIARKLHRYAEKYRQLYVEANGNYPVIWIQNNETGDAVVITESFNAELIKNAIAAGQI